MGYLNAKENYGVGHLKRSGSFLSKGHSQHEATLQGGSLRNKYLDLLLTSSWDSLLRKPNQKLGDIGTC